MQYTDFWIWFLQPERRVHLHETLIEMATISAVLYFGTAISGLVAISLPVPHEMDTTIIAAITVVSIGIAIVFYTSRQHFPLWLAISHIFVGIPLVGAAIWAGHAPAAAQISIVYIMSSIYCFHFLNIYASSAIVLLASTCFASIGYYHQWEGWQSLTALLLGCSFTVGIIVDLMVRRLHNLATTDSLTGLFNRHTWDTLFDQELRYAAREGHSLSLMVMDLNKFKRVNDTQGHLAGDRILKKVAAVIRGVVRDSDIAARWGGDEFIVLLRNCDLSEARVMENRFHQRLDGVIGVSVGLTDYQVEDTSDAMLARADKDMYARKHANSQR